MLCQNEELRGDIKLTNNHISFTLLKRLSKKNQPKKKKIFALLKQVVR